MKRLLLVGGAPPPPILLCDTAIDLSQAGGASLIQGILANTSNRVPVSVGLQFDGGMTLDLPSHTTLAFNHDALWNLL